MAARVDGRALDFDTRVLAVEDVAGNASGEGCTNMVLSLERVAETVARRLRPRVPVVDPVSVGASLAGSETGDRLTGAWSG